MTLRSTEPASANWILASGCCCVQVVNDGYSSRRAKEVEKVVVGRRVTSTSSSNGCDGEDQRSTNGDSPCRRSDMVGSE